jgi:invasion protein IalB
MRGFISILFGLALVVTAGSAFAQSAKKMAEHGDWATYSYQAQNGKVCYVLTVPKPKSMQPATLDHGDMFFFVSQRPGQAVSFEPQFIAGYELKDGSKVQVTIGDKKFSMFTKGKSAWVENAAEEPQLIAAMKAGADMQVQARSGRDNPTSYTFSLRGITAALNSISSCK